MYCQTCGTENAAGASTCTKCGTPLVGAPAASGVAASHDLYAGFWPRLAALVLDTLVLFAAMFILGFVLELVAPRVPAADGALDLLFVVVAWLYFALTRSSPRQASPGQRAMSLKVTDLVGQRIGFGRATGRHFASYLSGLFLGVGYLMNLFTARRQTLHDMIAGTLVVRAKATPEELVATPVAPRTPGWQVVLIILACTVPFIGILAAIAIPAYQDYTIRAQIADGLHQLPPLKAAIAEQAASGTPLEEISRASLGQIEEISSGYVRDVAIESSTIRITFGGNANPKIHGATLALTPAISDQGDIEWVCGRNAAPHGYGVLDGNYARDTSVPDKFLPRSCRSPEATAR